MFFYLQVNVFNISVSSIVTLAALSLFTSRLTAITSKLGCKGFRFRRKTYEMTKNHPSGENIDF